MVKILMLSGWHVHAKGYAQQLLRSNRVSIVGVWDEEPDRGKAWARELNTEFFESLDTALEADAQAVVVNAPTDRHKEVIVKAAKAGKHIFTEKVLAAVMKEAIDIRKAVEEAGVHFVISFPHRTDPKNLYAKQAVESGLLGDVRYFRVRNAHGGASDDWLPDHFYSKQQCGGGAMIDLGAHPMYLARWIMGRPSSVFSTFTYVTGKEVEDNAVSTFQYDNGAIGVVETGFITPLSPFSMEISGTRGTLYVDGRGRNVEQKVRLVLPNKQNMEGSFTPDRLPAPLDDALTQFLDAIEHAKPVVFDIDAAVELTEMMEYAYQSHHQKISVTFP